LKHPILHIGYAKTGTTWFQEDFYPNVNNINFFRQNTVLEDIITEYDSEKIHAKYSFDKRSVFCDENILGNVLFGSSSTKEITLRLKKIFPNGKVVIFIRNQLDLIASAYSQHIKSGGTFGIKRFFEQTKYINFYHQSFFLYEYFQFHEIICFYIEVFGKENVHVFAYEDFLEDNYQFLTNYTKILNLDVDLEKISFNKKNIKLRKRLFRFIKFSNHFTKKNTFYKQYYFHIPFLYNLINYNLDILNKYKIFGKPYKPIEIIGKKNYKFLYDFYKESNNILYDKIGLESMKKHAYPM